MPKPSVLFLKQYPAESELLLRKLKKLQFSESLFKLCCRSFARALRVTCGNPKPAHHARNSFSFLSQANPPKLRWEAPESRFQANAKAIFLEINTKRREQRWRGLSRYLKRRANDEVLPSPETPQTEHFLTL